MNYEGVLAFSLEKSPFQFSHDLLFLEEFIQESKGVKLFVRSKSSDVTIEMVRASLSVPSGVNWKYFASKENGVFIGHCFVTPGVFDSSYYSEIILATGAQHSETIALQTLLEAHPFERDFLLDLAGSVFCAGALRKSKQVAGTRPLSVTPEDSWVISKLIKFLYKGGKGKKFDYSDLKDVDKPVESLISSLNFDTSVFDTANLETACMLIPMLGGTLLLKEHLDQIALLPKEGIQHSFGIMDWKELLDLITYSWAYGLGNSMFNNAYKNENSGVEDTLHSWGGYGRYPLRSPDGYNSHLFLQSLDFTKYKMNGDAYQYFMSLRSNRVKILDISDYDNYIASNYDPYKGDAFARQMVLHSRLDQEYVPYGSFRFAVPSGTIFTGIQEVAVWTDGVSIWVMLSPGGHVIHWFPSDSTNPVKDSWLGFSDRFASALNLFLSALWMDLSTVRQDAFPKTKHVATSVGNGDGETRRRHKSKNNPEQQISSVRQTLTLPRQKLSTYQGVYKWGEDDVVARIKKRAHLVSGFLRQLPAGWQRSLQALERAKEFNFLVIPEGFTFVTPHMRGMKDADDAATPSAVETEKPIRVKGLATLLTLFSE